MLGNNAVWFKGQAQAWIVNDKGVQFRINAPMGFCDCGDNETRWQDAIDAVQGKSFTAIRTLEQVYMFADGLCKWRTLDDKAGVAMSSACANIRAYVVKCQETGKEIDRNALRPLLMAWLTAIYGESSLSTVLDASALTLTGKRVDDFIKRMGKDSARVRVPKSGRMVTGNRETVTKSGSAFMRELCRWSVSVSQRKYATVTRLVNA